MIGRLREKFSHSFHQEGKDPHPRHRRRTRRGMPCIAVVRVLARVENPWCADKADHLSGEGHLFIEPKNQADRMDQTVAWFDKYLR